MAYPIVSVATTELSESPAKADDFASEPNTKTTRKGMCLKPQAVPAQGKKPACFVLKKLDALCDGNPPNVHKIWPERTEKLRSSHGGNCAFCDLDGRK